MTKNEFEKYIEKKILEKTQYQGKQCKKCISASDLASEPLQVWLRYKHGIQENTSVGQNTIGSIVHLGFEKMFESCPSIKTEQQLEFNMGNDWKLTGTIDIFSKEKKFVADIKVTKWRTVSSIDENHQYAWQLNAYRYLCKKVFDIDVNMFLVVLLKDGGWDYKKKEFKQSLSIVEIPFIENIEIENKFNDLVAMIEKCEEYNTEPPQCKELWFTKNKQGNSFPTKCEFYCGYSELCPYYKRNIIKRIGDIV